MTARAENVLLLFLRIHAHHRFICWTRGGDELYRRTSEWDVPDWRQGLNGLWSGWLGHPQAETISGGSGADVLRDTNGRDAYMDFNRGPTGHPIAPGDENLLARAIFAETGKIPEDGPAVGWAAMNRLGNGKHNSTLHDVLFAPRQFQFTEEGGGPRGGSPQWKLSANPAAMDPIAKASFEAAQRTAHGILSGMIPDPTGGATHFFPSSTYNEADKNSARAGWFRDSLIAGKIGPSSYRSKSKTAEKNYFFIPTDR